MCTLRQRRRKARLVTQGLAANVMPDFLSASQQQLLRNPVGGGYWDTSAVHELMASSTARSKRSTERFLADLPWLPDTLGVSELSNEDGRGLVMTVAESFQTRAKRARTAQWIVQTVDVGTSTLVMLNDGRHSRRWCWIDGGLDLSSWCNALTTLVDGRDAVLWPHAAAVVWMRQWAAEQGDHKLHTHAGVTLELPLGAYVQPLRATVESLARGPELAAEINEFDHLGRLEAESIHIMREVIAQADNPVMLYSVGKDSAVMLHIARKAFYPSPPPFPLLHVDTRWKFQQMYDFRDRMAQASGMPLIVHVNPEGVARNINPFDHGSAVHTDVMKTQGLRQALEQHAFDVAFGGARRDEEKSRAKERVFSFRTEAHRWDPKNQRPELWNIYNGYKRSGESIRVFPLSNWTELDIWQYIRREGIAIVPLYFAAKRPVVERDGLILMVDDDRFLLHPGEQVRMQQVRFRTLGCYPLTGAVVSAAKTLDDILLELLQSHTSERQGRAIDTDESSSMEKKKQEGYF